VASLSITIDGLTKGTPVCLATGEVPVTDYEDVCLIRGDQGRAIRALLDRIADKWALLIIATLHAQRLRFTELQQRIPGISQRMLTLTLRKLERDGLVIRTAHAEVPPRVEYEPSELAATLIPHAVALANWAIEHNPDIDAHREAYDKRQR
jgi:DNA-binding HxlR family transcriptional regulator